MIDEINKDVYETFKSIEELYGELNYFKNIMNTIDQLG